MSARPFPYPARGSSAALSCIYLAEVAASKDARPLTRLLYTTIGLHTMIYVILW